jgi:ribosomal protein S18 acetylase RimI-like enzyme
MEVERQQHTRAGLPATSSQMRKSWSAARIIRPVNRSIILDMAETERPDVSVSIADACSDDLLNAVTKLIPQLSASAELPTRDSIETLIVSETTDLFVARLGGRIVGILTLVVFRIPTGVRAWIEDVVVDEAARGHGIGERLIRAAMQRAGERGAMTLDLTSRPAREAANRLYHRLGFKLRETNVYRIALQITSSDALN